MTGWRLSSAFGFGGGSKLVCRLSYLLAHLGLKRFLRRTSARRLNYECGRGSGRRSSLGEAVKLINSQAAALSKRLIKRSVRQVFVSISLGTG